MGLVKKRFVTSDSAIIITSDTVTGENHCRILTENTFTAGFTLIYFFHSLTFTGKRIFASDVNMRYKKMNVQMNVRDLSQTLSSRNDHNEKFFITVHLGFICTWRDTTKSK